MSKPEPAEIMPEAEKPEPGLKDKKPREIGGPKGLDPTRYGDWEKNGRCIDF
jgi:hypothetical protein